MLAYSQALEERKPTDDEVHSSVSLMAQITRAYSVTSLCVRHVRCM